VNIATVKFLLKSPHLSGPALALSRSLFPNTCGLDQNLRGRARRLRSRVSHPVKTAQSKRNLVEAQKNSEKLKKRGYFV